MGSLRLSLYTTHQSLFQVGIGSLSQSSNRIVSTSLLTGVGVCRRGWRADKTPLLVPHWPLDSGGWFSLATWVWKSSQVLAEISLTRNRLQIFPHVRQMNNRVVLINQSSPKPNTDGSNELLFHEDFWTGEEIYLAGTHISSSNTRRGIRSLNQMEPKPKHDKTIINKYNF